MLCVYDKYTKQDEFENSCGLAILRPSVMKTKKSLNGEYSLHIEYNMYDPDNDAWKFLVPYNIVRNSEGQLFFIHTCAQSTSGQLSVDAVHISYYLAHKLITDCSFHDLNCHDALQLLKEKTHITWMPAQDDHGHNISGYNEYDFAFSSDILDVTSSADYANLTPIQALIGSSNSITALYNAEIHRDNFRISVNRRKEGSRSDAFTITHGFNAVDIVERISIEGICTATNAYDNQHTEGFTVGWNYAGYSPHEIIAHPKFSYNGESRIVEDGFDYFYSHCDPLTSYAVRFKDLKHVDQYKDWSALQSYGIGDIGTVYSERLQINTQQKIIEQTINDLTTETEDIVLGNHMPNLYLYSRYNSFIATHDSAGTRLDRLEEMIR